MLPLRRSRFPIAGIPAAGPNSRGCGAAGICDSHPPSIAHLLFTGCQTMNARALKLVLLDTFRECDLEGRKAERGATGATRAAETAQAAMLETWGGGE